MQEPAGDRAERTRADASSLTGSLDDDPDFVIPLAQALAVEKRNVALASARIQALYRPLATTGGACQNYFALWNPDPEGCPREHRVKGWADEHIVHSPWNILFALPFLPLCCDR